MPGFSKSLKRTTAAAAIALCIAGCGSVAAPKVPRHPDPQRFLSVNAAARTVRLSVVMGYGSEVGAQNLDGARKGAALFSVPVGWRVLLECVNRLPTALYACALAPAPGVSRAQHDVTYVVHPAGGLSAGQSTTFAFSPTEASRYRIVGLTRSGATWVPLVGMWIVLRVSAGGVPRAVWLR